MDFELDVTKPSGETVTVTEPDPDRDPATEPDKKIRHRYEVLPFTKSRMRIFDKYMKRGRELKHLVDTGQDVDLDDAATSLIAALSGLLGSSNGGPPPETLLRKLWDDDYLTYNHLERLTEHVTKKASGDPPA